MAASSHRKSHLLGRCATFHIIAFSRHLPSFNSSFNPVHSHVMNCCQHAIIYVDGAGLFSEFLQTVTLGLLTQNFPPFPSGSWVILSRKSM